MIKWLLKRENLPDRLKEFYPASFLSHDGSTIWKDLSNDDNYWKIINGKFITINGVSFIGGDDLRPEVISRSDGLFQYYLTQNYSRIDEIPLQNSLNELIIDISDRSKNIFVRFYLIY